MPLHLHTSMGKPLYVDKAHTKACGGGRTQKKMNDLSSRNLNEALDYSDSTSSF